MLNSSDTVETNMIIDDPRDKPAKVKMDEATMKKWDLEKIIVKVEIFSIFSYFAVCPRIVSNEAMTISVMLISDIKQQYLKYFTHQQQYFTESCNVSWHLYFKHYCFKHGSEQQRFSGLIPPHLRVFHLIPIAIKALYKVHHLCLTFLNNLL